MLTDVGNLLGGRSAQDLHQQHPGLDHREDEYRDDAGGYPIQAAALAAVERYPAHHEQQRLDLTQDDRLQGSPAICG